MKILKPNFWNRKNNIVSYFLFPFSCIYQLLFFLKKKLTSELSFKIPVICIGNLYVGGTGKTPLALELYNILKLRGKNPGFVKKSYNYLYDEIIMLKKFGKTFVNKNRKKAIKSLISSGCDVAILDDGFQDFSIEIN